MRKFNLSKSEALSPQKTKSFFAMLVLAFGLFLGMAEEGKGQTPCPNQDYSQATRVFTIVYGGVTCNVTAELCIKCRPGTGPNDQSDIWVSDLYPYSCPGIPVAEIYRQISNQIIANMMDICGYGPCPTPTLYRIVLPVCVKKYRTFDANNNPIIKVTPCDWAAKCVKRFSMCWNGSSSNVYDLFVGIEGTPSCSATTEPDSDNDGVSTDYDVNGYSNCWILPCY